MVRCGTTPSKDTLRSRRDIAGSYLVNAKHWRYGGDTSNSKIVWAVDLIAAEFNKRGLRAAKETLGNPDDPRENGPVIADWDWSDGRQAARLL